MVKDTDVVYIAVLKTTSLCTFLLQTKLIDPLRQYFYIFWQSAHSKIKSNFW